MNLSANMFLQSQWNIDLPLKGEKLNYDSADRIIFPALSSVILCPSQDFIKFPEKVFLLKNLQVWRFVPVQGREEDKLYTWVYWLSSTIISNLITIRIVSNLNALVGTDPLLGVDKEFKKVKILSRYLPVMMNNWNFFFIQAIIQRIAPTPEVISKPVWKFHGPINKKWKPDSNFREKQEGILSWWLMTE